MRKSPPNPLTPRVAYGLLAVMMLIYIILHSQVAIQLHEAFVTSADDLSNIDQVVWNSQHGRLLERTTGTRSLPRYGEHLEPIWIALGLIYLFYDHVAALLIAQTIALALGALPVFWFAREAWGEQAKQPSPPQPPSTGVRLRRPNNRRGGRRGRKAVKVKQQSPSTNTSPDHLAGLAFAAVYLLSPFIARANSAEVHAMPFAVAPFLLALFWGWQGRWKRVIPLALLLFLVREDAGLLVIAFGLWATLALRRWRAGVALLGSGFLALMISLFGIIAYFADQRFSGRDSSIFFERYTMFGEGVGGIVWGMMTRLDLWAELITDPWRWAFLQDFIISTGGLLLLAPSAWLLFAPHFLLNFLSDYLAQYGSLQHYGAPLLPGLMVAAILGGANALRWGKRHPIWRICLLILLLSGAVWSARHAVLQPLASSWIQPPVTAHHRLLDEFAALIPSHAPLSVDPQLHPHFAHRPDVYRFPERGENTQWILVDVTTNRTSHPADLAREIDTLLAGDWGVVKAQDGYLLLQHGNSTKQIDDSFYDFGHPTAPPTYPLALRAGEQLELLGYDIEQDFWGRVHVAWHVRPLAQLAANSAIDSALLNSEGHPIAETAHQPLTLLFWTPLMTWQIGQTYLIQTLPRASDPLFWPAFSIRDGDQPYPWHECLPGDTLCATSRTSSPLRFTQIGPWLAGGTWQLEDNHLQAAQTGWRQGQAPVLLSNQSSNQSSTQPATQPATWPIARLAAWQITTSACQDSTCQTATQLHLTLHWQASQDHAPSTQRFIHLVPSDGPPVPFAQHDSPLGNDYPVTSWITNEWVTETHTIALPPDAPTTWRILIGLYDPQTGKRLPVQPDDGNATFELK